MGLAQRAPGAQTALSEVFGEAQALAGVGAALAQARLLAWAPFPPVPLSQLLSCSDEDEGGSRSSGVLDRVGFSFLLMSTLDPSMFWWMFLFLLILCPLCACTV